MNADVIATYVHPCTYVTESIQLCIVEEGNEAKPDNCWTVDTCLDPAKRALNKFGDSDELDTTTPSGAIATISFTMGLLAALALL